MLAAGIHTARYLDVQVLIEQVLGIFIEYYFFQDLCGTGTASDTTVTSIGAWTCGDISQGIVTVSYHIQFLQLMIEKRNQLFLHIPDDTLLSEGKAQLVIAIGFN